MNIVYTFDDAYAEITGVSIISLLENNNPQNISIYIVDCGISKENKEKLNRICENYGSSIEFFQQINIYDKIGISIKPSDWSDVCYIRLFYSTILPERIRKALHIDCDTIIRDDLNQIYNQNIEQYYYAACIDCYPKPRRLITMKRNVPYFSNGLILMNLKKWRDDNIESLFIKYIRDNQGSLPHLDQDVLNYVCAGKSQVLPARYNVMTQTLFYGELGCRLFFPYEPYYNPEEIRGAVKKPGVVHFTGSRYARRPWQQPSAHWYNKEWLVYYKKTDYYNTKSLVKKKRKLSTLKHIYSLFWINACRIPALKLIRFNLDRKLLWKI